MQFLTLAIAVRAEPLRATALVKDALMQAGAVITSAQRLGNQALVFAFELTCEHAARLRDGLAKIGQLLEGTAANLEDAQRRHAATDELTCSLHVSLVHDAPDERVPLPKVPG